MNPPFLTALCVTCGRTKMLEGAIADFLAQTYTGPKELLVLNTCPRQTLRGEFPNVKIFNLQERPECLGHARNTGVLKASGTHIVTWDDDDAFLPNHLQVIADALTNHAPDRSPPLDPKKCRCHWIWLDKQFWGWGDSIKEIVKGQCPCFAFSREAWEQVGGYPKLSVGEDRGFISKVTEKFPGSVVVTGEMPTFIYRWANGVYHMSGQSDDKPGEPGAMVRYWADLTRRFERKEEPVGEVVLNPHRNVDWTKLAKEYVEGLLKKKSMSDVCLVQLGRYGDIINMLPIAQHIAEQYGKPHLMVSKEFASLLDGVSYVIPCPVDWKNDELHDAVETAKKSFKHVVVTQVWGKNHSLDRECRSFNEESWRVAGFIKKFPDEKMAPKFDVRDSTREIAVLNKLHCSKKPLILVNVTHSTSSPYEYGGELMARIRRGFEIGYTVVDLGEIRLERIYDALGLMDNAAALVSIDTALLHLAAASDVPYVAMTNPLPWLGTVPRRAPVAIVDYREAGKRGDAVMHALRVALSKHRDEGRPRSNGSISTPPVRKVFHVCEKHQTKSSAEEARKAAAQKSWEVLYENGVIPAYYTHYRRDARSIGDARNLPFLKDCLEVGMSAASPDDIIFFTNDDNWLHPDLLNMIKFRVSVFGCCCSQRCEFYDNPMPPASAPPSEFARLGGLHPGRDLFAFTKKWLEAHWNSIPDFLLGASEWDWCLASIVRLEFGIVSKRHNYDNCLFPADLERGYVSHQFHPPAWNTPGKVHTAPSQRHNRQLFYKWAQEHAKHIKFDKNLAI